MVFRVGQIEFLTDVANVFELFAYVFACSHLVCVYALVALIELLLEPSDILLDHVDHVDFLIACIDFERFVQELLRFEFGNTELIDVVPKSDFEFDALERGFDFVLGLFLRPLELHQVLDNLVLTGNDVDDLVFLTGLLEVVEVNNFFLIGPTPDFGPEVDHGPLLSLVDFGVKLGISFRNDIIVNGNVLFNA